MGLFDKFKKNKFTLEPPKDNNFKSGTIQKTPSIILSVPKDPALLNDTDALLKSLLEYSEINVISRTQTDDGFIVAFDYEGEEYSFEMWTASFSLPQLFRINHDFTDEEIAAMESAEKCLVSKMTFGKDNCKSYHLQIKLLCAMIPDPAGIVDDSAEKMLSGRWAKLAASSKVAPAPDYVYIIQAVSGDDNFVWIHTHGLNRCGGIELELLNADKENYQDLSSAITVLASRIVSKSEFADEYEPIYAAELSDGSPLVASWISWMRIVETMPDNALGGKKDREDDFHAGASGIVYVYENEENCNKKLLSPITVYSEQLKNNPMLMITSEETDRMRRLAAERLGYLRQLFETYKDKEAAVLVKIGLEVDEEFKNGDMKEHIWFEIKEMSDNSLTAELTQEAYYVKAIKPGDTMQCTYDQITDWVVLTPEERYTPDNVYKLDF